jgi:hypothetical protein
MHHQALPGPYPYGCLTVRSWASAGIGLISSPEPPGDLPIGLGNAPALQPFVSPSLVLGLRPHQLPLPPPPPPPPENPPPPKALPPPNPVPPAPDEEATGVAAELRLLVRNAVLKAAI